MGIGAIGQKLDASDLPRYSVEEWETWEGKWELIEGIPFAMSAMPTKKHQKVNARIWGQFESLLDDCPECEAYIPINFKIDAHNVIHPDVIVVCNDNDDEIYLTKIPNIAVEVISKGSIKQDTRIKPKIYAALGVKYYVLVDPKQENIKIFIEKDNAYFLDAEGRSFNYLFETEECPINFDFSKIWK